MKYKLTAKKKRTSKEILLTESDNKELIESLYHSCVSNSKQKLYIGEWTFNTNFKLSKKK